MSNVKPVRGSVINAKRLKVKFKGKSICDVLRYDRRRSAQVLSGGFFLGGPSIREKMDA